MRVDGVTGRKLEKRNGRNDQRESECAPTPSHPSWRCLSGLGQFDKPTVDLSESTADRN
jgi:hypothetical protein